MSKKKNCGRLFENIPDELFIDLIFQYVGNKDDFKAFQLVCKKFDRILRIEYLFKKLCLRSWKKPFVEELPLFIMERYDNKFRNMFFLDNKYRYDHYAIVRNYGLGMDPRNIRKYDKENDADIENQCIQGVCLDLDYKDFYDKEEKFKAFGDNTLSLELICDDDNWDEYSLQDGPVVMEFFPLKKPEMKKYYKDNIDRRFPRYFMVYHYPGDNISGYVYEEKSKKPIMSNGDGNLGLYDYEKGREGRLYGEIEKEHKNFLVYQTLLKLYNFYECERSDFGSDENIFPLSMKHFQELARDRLDYTTKPIFQLNNKNGKKAIVLIHIVDNSGRWSNRGTMGHITKKYGKKAKKDYEKSENTVQTFNENICSYIADKKIWICSMRCVSYNKDNNSRSFTNWNFDQCLGKLKTFCLEKEVTEIHFDRPNKESIKIWDDCRNIRRYLNKLVVTESFKVVFHDRYLNSSPEKFYEGLYS